MRGLVTRARPSAHFCTPRPAAITGSGSLPALAESPRSKRGLLSGILESVSGLLGFGNDQVHPSDPKDTGNAGASSIVGTHEPTNVKPPVAQPSSPAQVPPASYPAPGGGGGQGERPSSNAPMSVSSAPQPSSAGTEAGPAVHSTSPPAAINFVPTAPAAPPAQDPSQSFTNTPAGWQSISPPASSAPSPTQPPPPGAQIGHTKQFPLAAAAAIGAVLGFVVVSALFWAVWLALRKRRRASPEFASVHPKCASVPETDENPFTHRATRMRRTRSTLRSVARVRRAH